MRRFPPTMHFAVRGCSAYIQPRMSDLLNKTAWALAIGLVLIQVFPVAADLLVCIADRPDRGCCETSSTPDARPEASAGVLDGAECSCCVRVLVVSNTAGATAQKLDAYWSVESGGARVHVAPISRPNASVGNEEPGNARLPSLRTVVLLI